MKSTNEKKHLDIRFAVSAAVARTGGPPPPAPSHDAARRRVPGHPACSILLQIGVRLQSRRLRHWHRRQRSAGGGWFVVDAVDVSIIIIVGFMSVAAADRIFGDGGGSQHFRIRNAYAVGSVVLGLPDAPEAMVPWCLGHRRRA